MKKYPHFDGMISASKGHVVSVIKASPRSILIELYDPLKETPEEEPDFLERCIEFAQKEVETAMRDYAALS